MKVCILATSFPLGKGDISGMFILEQARHLVRRGINVRVVAPHHPGASLNEETDGISVHRFRYILPERIQRLCYGSGIPNNLREFPWTSILLPFLLLTFTFQAIKYARDCDVIHAHWSIAGLAGFIAAKLLGKPIVLNMHQGTTRTLTKIERLLLERVDYVVTNSSYTLSHILKAATPIKFRVIPPGVDTLKFQPQPQGPECRQLISEISRDTPIIFTLGRLVEWKGHTYLIDAMCLLTEDPKPHLLIGGEGTLRRELGNQVHEKGLDDRVTFLDHIPGHLITHFYSLADIYVQPSIVDRDGTTEGLGVTLLEAMACETPCIASRTGGIPDIISNGENGYLVEPANPRELADRISILLKDASLRTKMGKLGRSFVEDNYSWAAKAKELEEIYTGLIHQVIPNE